MADAIFISEEAGQEFWQNGAIRVQAILDKTWLRLHRDTVDEEIRNAGPGGHFADPGRATLASGGLQYVRGSHPSGAWYRPQRFTRSVPIGDDVVYEASSGRVQLEECRGLADGDPLPSEAFPLVSTKELCR
jgi:hypothetical protein